MSVVRRGAVALGAALLVAALAGCSASAPRAAGNASTTSGHTSARVSLVKPTAAAAAGHTNLPVVPTAPATPAVPPPSPFCAENTPGVDHIYVNVALQHLWACAGTTLFTDTAVTTGAYALTNVHDATPLGTFHIFGKMRNVYLSGHDANGSWHDFVAYWMPFYGAYGFHDASWQTFPFGSSLYATQGSHGCVHVPVDVLGNLFNWAPIGTAVTIVSS